MKKTLLFLFLLAGNTIFAQDYAPLPDTGIRRYFTNSAGYLRGIRVDSVVQEAGYKRYVTFRTARGWKSFSELADSNGACWVGKNVRAYPNGDWQFPNVAGDTILVKTGAKVGERWPFYTDISNKWFEAKVAATDTQTVFGVLDSVKIVELTAMTGNTPLLTDSVTGFRIVLSKAHGFSQVPDLYLFPYLDLDSNQRDYWYDNVMNGYNNSPFSQLVFKNITNWNPTYRNLFSYEVGDVLYTRHLSNMGPIQDNFLDTVLSKQEYPDYTDYIFNRWHWRRVDWYGALLSVQNGIASRRVDNTTLVDTTFMPEEYYETYYPKTSVVYLLRNDTTFCMLSDKIKLLLGDRSGLYVRGLIYPARYVYKLGLGLVAYDQGNGDGGTESDRLEGYVKQGFPCKTIPVVPSGVERLSFKLNDFKLYPQPATTEVFLQASELRYPATIRIQNLQGQLLSVQELSAAGNTISTANLPAGLYLLSVTDAGGNSAVQKLLIEAN